MIDSAYTRAPVCCMCKGPLPEDGPRYRCSVSACNAGRVKLLFCSVACFERHIPTARHRKAAAVEDRVT